MRLALPFAACLALAACGGTPPPADAPAGSPPAAATAGEAAREPEATELRDAMQAPLDKARAAEAAQAERDAERERALEDAGG